MTKFNVRANVLLSGLAFGTSLVVQVVIFRLAISRIGIEQIGLFSLIQGLMLFARAFETGVGQNLIRRIAIAGQDKDASEARWRVVFAGLVLILGPTSVLSLIAYWAIGAYLAVSSPDIAATTRDPLIAMSVAIAMGSVVNGVFSATLDGLGKMLWRNSVLLLTSLLSVACAVPLMRWAGLNGYASIFLLSVFLQMIASILLVAVFMRSGLIGGFRRLGATINALLVENLAMNGSGIARLAFEPVTRILLKEFSGLEAVGVFDILLRLIVGGRALVQTALSPLLYLGAREQQALADHQVAVFARAQAMIASASAHIAALAVIAAPGVSFALLGKPDPTAIEMFVLLGLSAGVNLAGTVGYNLAMSGGQVRPIFWIHVAMLFTNLGLGFLLGLGFSSLGVVLAYAIMMSLGGLLSLSFVSSIEGLGFWQVVRTTWPLRTVLALVLVSAAVLGGSAWTLAHSNSGLLLAGTAAAGIITVLSLFRSMRRIMARAR